MPAHFAIEGASVSPPDSVAYQPEPSTSLEWTSPTDRENPRNFPLATRIYTTAAVSFLAFVTAFAASIYSPAIEEVQNTFEVSEEVSLLPLSFYNLGLAFGPLVGAPLSEVYGRKAVFLLTTPVFALLVLGAGLSRDVASLCVCRFIAAVFAAPAISNASATIADITDGRYRGIALGIYYAVPSCGAVLGPLVGGFVVIGKGWRWTQWVTLMFIGAAYLPVLFTPETYKVRLLQQRAKKLGIDPATAQPKKSISAALLYFLRKLFFRPIHMLFTEPIVTLVCVYSGFLFGLTYTFVVASPWVWSHYYAFSPAAQSLSFLSLTLGVCLVPIPQVLADRYIYQPRLRRHLATSPPSTPFPAEQRLSAALPASLLLPLSLFAYAWTARASIHWVVPMLFQALAMLSSIVVYGSVNLYMLDAYGPLYGASASGAAMLCRYTFSAAFPMFSLRLYRALGAGWAGDLLGFLAIVLAAGLWGFWRWGKGVKGSGKYELST
nr:hypothetical protein B0A51_02595 [Rachicladosporium sp. CCFEE 5018]